jgi:hypothetical protein
MNKNQWHDCPYFFTKSKLIVDNHSEIIKFIEVCHSVHQEYFRGESSTWTYSDYNFWAFSSPNKLMYSLYDELRDIINEHIPEKRKWMQCWLNYHKCDEVLGWHNHDWDYHGYISIDPKNTTTVFENWEVKNDVGNIYLGRGNNMHKVVVNEPYKGHRITLGFDVSVTPCEKEMSNNLGLMPL